MKAFIICIICIIAVSGAKDPCDSKYRTFDGSCNNKQHRSWGAADTAQRRFSDDKGPLLGYEDGVSIPRGGLHKSRLPNPRAVSNAIADEAKGTKNQEDPKRSAQSFAKGQIIAHDVIATKFPEDVKCCDDDSPHKTDPNVCFTFTTPSDDTKLPPSQCMNFVRASKAPESPFSTHREQVNLASSFLDASFLYGSSVTRANMVREENSFLMKTSKVRGDKTSKYDNLPVKPKQFRDQCVKTVKADKCVFAGDSRVSETPNLQLNHLIWIKEHNRIATKLHDINKHWDNETVFQETRRIIIAMWQHIIYNEYLPNVLDDTLVKRYNLKSKGNGYNNVYNSSIDPSIRNSFGVAAWRFGHSQVVSEQSLLFPNCSFLARNQIEDHFHSPHILQVDPANTAPLARFISYTESMKIDSHVVNGLRNKLFNNSDPAGDLFTRNIQRARDHGVPGYNAWRVFCGLDKRKNFNKFGKFKKDLKKLYKNKIDDVDLFVGGLLEKGEDGTVGETFGCIIAKQFQILKTGDRFWYETDEAGIKFEKDQLKSIKKKTLLSTIFCRNSNLDEIQKDIFKPGKNSNLVKCDNRKKLTEVDLSLWKEPQET